MLKEILIAGLLGSVSSIDKHRNTQYLNNTVYEDLKCNGCKSRDVDDIFITYVYEKKHDSYTYMNLFLHFYKKEVVDPYEEMLIKDKTENYGEPAIRNSLNTNIFSLETKISDILSEHRSFKYKNFGSNSFKLSNDGLLIYGKIN